MSAKVTNLQFDPAQLAKDQSRAAMAQRTGANVVRDQYDDVGDRANRLADEGMKEKEKNMFIQMLSGAAGAQAGRGVPAYNQNMANGRQGLVDPALTQQQTMMPMPWDEKFASAKNLAGIQNSTRLYGPSEQISAQVGSMTPQMQHAMKPPSTIYVQTPADWMTNRLNLSLMRRRENSIWAVV